MKNIAKQEERGTTWGGQHIQFASVLYIALLVLASTSADDDSLDPVSSAKYSPE